MSKGSPKIVVRVPADLLAKIRLAIDDSVQNCAGAPYTVSSFVLACIEERFRHRARAKRASARKRARRAVERAREEAIDLDKSGWRGGY